MSRAAFALAALITAAVPLTLAAAAARPLMQGAFHAPRMPFSAGSTLGPHVYQATPQRFVVRPSGAKGPQMDRPSSAQPTAGPRCVEPSGRVVPC
jgi:hypothetical protein